MARLQPGSMDAYWSDPRNGQWWVDGKENNEMIPFLTNLISGEGTHAFDPPRAPQNENDWVLVLK